MSEKEVFYLDVDELKPDPNQPRRYFDEKEINSTALTIEKQGLINPIEVNGDNRIVTGEIRWRATLKAVEMNPDKPELRRVKCIKWKGTPAQRFERQVIENLHHHALTEIDRDAAIVKLWEGGEYPTHESLGKAVGLTRESIKNILLANEFRKTTTKKVAATISNRAIIDTDGLEHETREKILTGVSEGKIKSSDIREVRKIAQASEELLQKVADGEISVERATQAAETITKIEQRGGVTLSSDQKQRLANKVAEDERLIEKYEEDVLARVYTATTAPKTGGGSGVSEPIGRSSPVNNIIRVKDEIKDNFQRYLGNCDMNERTWARRILTEIKTEIDSLLELISDE